MAGAPITKNDTDDYPYAGTVQVKGMNSTLQMTVLSTSNVRLDLDADGNGSFESTETVPGTGCCNAIAASGSGRSPLGAVRDQLIQRR